MIKLSHPQVLTIALGAVTPLQETTVAKLCVHSVELLPHKVLTGLRPSPTSGVGDVAGVGDPVVRGETVTGEPIRCTNRRSGW